MIPVPENVLANLAAAYDVPPAALSYFSGGREESDGVLYAYPFASQQRLLKVMAVPADKELMGLFQLEERLKFARFVGENGVRLVLPQLSAQGRLFEVFREEKHIWVAYCMDLARGRTPEREDLTPDFYRSWGQIVGRMHFLTQQYPTWQSSIHPAAGAASLTWQEEWQDFYDWAQDDEVRQKWVDLRSALEKLPLERRSFGFIHNDLHQWNLLVDEGQITLLDFDVANHHWFITDISIACSSVLFDDAGGMHRPVHHREKLVDFLRYFMEGYQREFQLDRDWLDKLDLFFAYRRILLFIVMQGWIASQPEMHASWRKMIMEQPTVAGRISTEVMP